MHGAKPNHKRIVKLAAGLVLLLLAAAVFVSAVMNTVVVAVGNHYVLSPEEAAAVDADCIVVLGAMVYGDGSLSVVLADRVDIAVALYRAGGSTRLLMSGDHARENYDEVGAMKQYAVKAGIDPDHIFMDHAGLSTYESVYRAKHIFGAKKILIVTQDFHLTRALFLARALGLEAYGVTSDLHRYSSWKKNEVREYAARVKAVADAIFRPQPTFLGEAVPLDGKPPEG